MPRTAKTRERRNTRQQTTHQQTTKDIDMHNINPLNASNCVLALIDHQPWVAFPIQSIAPQALTNNVLALAKAAKALAVPVVLTTISGASGPLKDPLFAELSRLFPEQTPIDRNNTNAWSDPRFVAAIEATGRHKLVMAGLWTEVCLAQTVLSAIAAGYEVYFVADASGGLSVEAHELAKARMMQAGARPLSWMAFMAEVCPDNSAPEYSALYPVMLENGMGVKWAVEYYMANLPRRADMAAGA
jgi:nicotinamidase-related amidase